MTNFLLSNSPDFYLDIEANFLYNYYSDDETQTDDTIILDNKVNFYKCIDLKISARSKYDKRLLKYYENIDIEDFSLLNNKNINKDTLFFFNRLHRENQNLVNLNFDNSKKSIEKINQYYNISKENYQLAKKFFESNKKVSISKNFSEKFKKLNYFNEYFTNKNLQAHDFYVSSLDKNSQNNVFSNVEDISLFSKFNVYRKKSVYTTKNFENYYVAIGFLVEKYIKTDNDKYVLATSFYKNNSQNSNIPALSNNVLEHTIDYSTNIKDNAVKYGKTYKYVVYPVYLTSMPTKHDYHTVDDFIVCGYPYITKDIECVENVRPIPPSQISFKYSDKKNHLKIYWQKPLDEQGDIKGYQIFKRHSLSDPFVLIKQLEFHSKSDSFYKKNERVSSFIVEKMQKENDTFYFDKSFKKEKIQIYTICSIDAHGFVSNYSAQYAVKYNQYTKKCDIDLISNSGAPLHMPNLMLPRKTKFFENEDYIVNNMPIEEKVKKFTLYVTPEYNKLDIGTTYHKSVLGDNYKLSIFKLENASVYTENIKILNFNDENFI